MLAERDTIGAAACAALVGGAAFGLNGTPRPGSLNAPPTDDACAEPTPAAVVIGNGRTAASVGTALTRRATVNGALAAAGLAGSVGTEAALEVAGCVAGATLVRALALEPLPGRSMVDAAGKAGAESEMTSCSSVGQVGSAGALALLRWSHRRIRLERCAAGRPVESPSTERLTGLAIPSARPGVASSERWWPSGASAGGGALLTARAAAKRAFGATSGAGPSVSPRGGTVRHSAPCAR